MMEQGLSQECGLLLETEAGCRGDLPASEWVHGGGGNEEQTCCLICIPALQPLTAVLPISTKDTGQTRGRT